MATARAAADSNLLGGQVIAGKLGSYRIADGGGWLGGGASANVFLAVNEYTMDRVAIKAIDRFVVEESGRKRELLVRELNIATKLRHPNIINLMEVVFDENYVHIVMELAAGGELYGSVKDGAMDEPRAKRIFHQIVSAMAYCHANGICHRDLKLENLVLGQPGTGQEHVKVTDFGLSKDAAMHSQPNTKVGTISYMAPEVTEISSRGSVRGTYDGKAADVWSLGVILYILVFCAYPFGYDGPAEYGGEPTKHVCARIRSGEYSTSGKGLSKDCLSLLKAMFAIEPERRITAEEALSHPWLAAVRGSARELSSAASAAATAGFETVTWPLKKGGSGNLWSASAAAPEPEPSDRDVCTDDDDEDDELNDPRTDLSGSISAEFGCEESSATPEPEPEPEPEPQPEPEPASPAPAPQPHPDGRSAQPALRGPVSSSFFKTKKLGRKELRLQQEQAAMRKLMEDALGAELAPQLRASQLEVVEVQQAAAASAGGVDEGVPPPSSRRHPPAS